MKAIQQNPHIIDLLSYILDIFWVIALPYVPIATFEDKRRMNWDKGQQELERRRRELQEKEQKEKVDFYFNLSHWVVVA